MEGIYSKSTTAKFETFSTVDLFPFYLFKRRGNTGSKNFILNFLFRHALVNTQFITTQKQKFKVINQFVVNLLNSCQMIGRDGE